MTERYIELHAASAFSFLEAGSQPEALMERAAELEMPAMAIADRNGVYGAARFHTSGQSAAAFARTLARRLRSRALVSGSSLLHGCRTSARRSRHA